jgi:hypothetical protein
MALVMLLICSGVGGRLLSGLRVALDVLTVRFAVGDFLAETAIFFVLAFFVVAFLVVVFLFAIFISPYFRLRGFLFLNDTTDRLLYIQITGNK